MSKNSRLAIAVDLDGVLGDQLAHIIPLVNKKYGLSLSRSDIVEWDLKIANTTISDEIVAALGTKEYILNMPVIPGAQQALEELYPDYTIKIITSRPKTTDQFTLQWLNKHFKFHHYQNTHNQPKTPQNTATKIIIEDHYPTAKTYTQNGGTAILLTQPYNQKFQHKNPKIIPCGNWKQIVYNIKKL